MITKQRSMDDLWQEALRAQMPNSGTPRSEAFEKALKEKRRKNSVASKKYSKTDKGKKANVAKCHNYFLKHKDKFTRRAQMYQERFKNAYGVTLMSWNYWLRKLRNGQCDESDIPDKYAQVFHDWKTNGKYNL